MTFSSDPTAPLAPRPPSEMFTVGERVRLAAWTDEWLQGDRYATVTKLGRKLVTVKLETSGRTRRFNPTTEVITPIYD